MSVWVLVQGYTSGVGALAAWDHEPSSEEVAAAVSTSQMGIAYGHWELCELTVNGVTGR